MGIKIACTPSSGELGPHPPLHAEGFRVDTGLRSWSRVNCKAVGVLSSLRCVTELVGRAQVRVRVLDANLGREGPDTKPRLAQKKGEPGAPGTRHQGRHGMMVASGGMEDPMAEDPRKLMTMSDDELMFYTLSGEQGSYVHEIGQTALNMRVSLRSLEVTREMARANELLSNETSSWPCIVDNWGEHVGHCNHHADNAGDARRYGSSQIKPGAPGSRPDFGR